MESCTKCAVHSDRRPLSLSWVEACSAVVVAYSETVFCSDPSVTRPFYLCQGSGGTLAHLCKVLLVQVNPDPCADIQSVYSINICVWFAHTHIVYALSEPE